MTKFVFLYTGNGGTRDEWIAWFAEHGARFVDSGNPLGPGRVLNADGASDTSEVTGYSLVIADDLAAAEALAATSPATGVQVYEALPM
jgi:hypothetical protein